MRHEYTPSNAAVGVSRKLAAKYEGPFEVKKVLGDLVVLLEDSGRKMDNGF